MPRVAKNTSNSQTATRHLASIREGADYYKVSTKTLRRWGAAGRITLYRTGPRLLRVDLNELDALAQPIPTTRTVA